MYIASHQVELSRWIGVDAIRASLYPKMRDAMKEDIDKAVAALLQLGIPKPTPERLTRKEQARLAAANAAGDSAPMEIDEDASAAVEAAVVDEDAPAVSAPILPERSRAVNLDMQIYAY